MRIVDVCGFYSPKGGGVRTYIEQKLSVAEQFGHDITILAPGDDDAVFERGPCARIETIACPRFPLDRNYWYFSSESAVHAALDRIAPDFVEASTPWRSAVMASAWRPEIPKSIVMHSEPLSAHVYRWVEGLVEPEEVDQRMWRFWDHLRKFGNSFDAVICANRFLEQRLKAGGVNNCVMLPMGVQSDAFSPARRDEALRAQLLEMCDLPPDATLLLSAGRLATEKRLPMLVEAVTQAGRHKPLGFVILGEGRTRKAILRAIGGNPHIRLLKPVRDRDQFAAILASADALLHGCEAETFGMAAAEARASGIPVIVPDEGGAADFARDGWGITYRSADLDDAVRAILELPEGREWLPDPVPPRTMEDHFRALFALYEEIRRRPRTRQAA